MQHLGNHRRGQASHDGFDLPEGENRQTSRRAAKHQVAYGLPVIERVIHQR